MQTAFITTLSSFYDHNSPLVYFGGMAFLSLLMMLKRPSRFFTLTFLGFLILTFSFEYDKHIFLKVRTDMLDLIFPEGARFTKYSYLRIFLETFLPIILDLIGWGSIALALISKAFKKNKNNITI